MAKSGGFDLIILDLMMPQVDGLTAACASATFPPKKPRNSLQRAGAWLQLFEHADIYGQGTCEEAFADRDPPCPPLFRDKILLQSKCGIVSGVMYDFSKEHILSSVDGILKRLRTDYLDVLVLHRPDA